MLAEASPSEVRHWTHGLMERALIDAGVPARQRRQMMRQQILRDEELE